MAQDLLTEIYNVFDPFDPPQTIFEHQWELLRQVANSKNIPNKENDKEYPRLLASRCILEYRYYNENDELTYWHDVHPLVKELDKFTS